MRFEYTEGTLEKGFNKCRELLSQGKTDEVRDLADYLIAVVANERFENDATENTVLDGVKVGVWLKRLWVDILENNNLMLS